MTGRSMRLNSRLRDGASESTERQPPRLSAERSEVLPIGVLPIQDGMLRMPDSRGRLSPQEPSHRNLPTELPH